ncbi:MAG: protein-export membrane protein SecF [Desulfobacula sp. GWF2_41_7]|nr:MAG: protein-export membrane protein SecF [Desulfobacula sp. GWF2_41_7]
MEFIKPGINIDFMGKWKIGFILSIILILISIGSLIVHKGPNYGIDFAGGTLIQVKFSESIPIDKIRDGLTNVGLKDASIQKFGHDIDHEYLIRTIRSEMSGSGLSQSITEAVKASTGITPEIRRIEMVGPQVGEDLRNKALLAIFYTLLFITIYISARFENKFLISGVIAGSIMTVVYFLSVFNVGITVLIAAALVVSLLVFWIFKFKYAIGAIIALIHDVTITIGIFSILNLDFSLPVIAALLTIIGYSLNDTIIIFDRIRENLKGSNPTDSLPILFNRSINETLSRTILTSGTTLIVVLALYFLGGEIIHNFAFAMLVGIAVGTYSSIFIASPIVLFGEKK